VEQDDGDDLVHGHRLARLVDGADAVGVAVRGEAQKRARLGDAALERREVAVNRLRRDAAEERVARGADGLDAEPPAREKTLHPTPARAVHRIDDDVTARRAQPFKINVRRDLLAVALDG
jgi:hypothetical protein